MAKVRVNGQTIVLPACMLFAEVTEVSILLKHVFDELVWLRVYLSYLFELAGHDLTHHLDLSGLTAYACSNWLHIGMSPPLSTLYIYSNAAIHVCFER